MSNNNIALTSSMRSNLLSLKGTQKLLDKTQDHLSTGYKVNSAMDNPSSYFTAQALNSRASDLSSLLDSIGQAISTLEVADEGITSLQDFVDQAKSIANSARDTANVPAKVSSSIKFDKENLKLQKVTEAIPNAAAADKMTIRYGDSTKLKGDVNVREETKLSNIGIADSTGDAGKITVDGKSYQVATGDANQMVTTIGSATDSFKLVSANGDTDYVVADGNGKEYKVAGDASAVTVGGFVNGITVTETVTEAGIATLDVTGTIADDTAATSATAAASAVITVKNGSTVGQFADVVQNMIGSDKFSASVSNGNMVFATKDTTSIEISGPATGAVNIATAFGMDVGQDVSITATDTAESLRVKIDKFDGITAEFNDEGRLVVKSEQGDDMVISGVLAEKLGIAGAATNGNNERAAYAKQFDNVLTQMNELVQDTSYKGINLLNGDNLTVVFNETRTSTLELKGVTFNAQGLGFTNSENEWKSTASIDKALDQITKATSLLRAQASEFGQNLSTVQIREDFTQNMINNLQSGADKLTLADMNEEAANMLALQTRQQLGVNSLSMASQASQSVLKLF